MNGNVFTIIRDADGKLVHQTHYACDDVDAEVEAHTKLQDDRAFGTETAAGAAPVDGVAAPAAKKPRKRATPKKRR